MPAQASLSGIERRRRSATSRYRRDAPVPAVDGEGALQRRYFTSIAIVVLSLGRRTDARHRRTAASGVSQED